MPAQDSLQVLTEDQFIALVRQFHPVVKQGALQVELARAELQSIRGQFDPVFYYNNDQKTFDGKNYYNYSNAEIMLPTWFGIEAYAGLENNTGNFINTEVTKNKSAYAGVSVPLLKDLVLDKRRAALQQGKLYTELSEWERRNLVNDLLLEAYLTYWNWAKDFQVFKIIEQTIQLNEQRYQLVRKSFLQGDRAAVDTTEAFAQLLGFQQQRAEAFLKFKKSSFELAVFLWQENGEPAYLRNEVIPDSSWLTKMNVQSNPADLENWLTNTINSHPKLQLFNAKIESLEVERRLKFQQLLPKADLKYNFLQSGYRFPIGKGQTFFENNYKFGLNIAVPIPNRNGFGQYKSAKVKVKITNLDRQLTQQTIENKVRFHYNEVLNLRQQVTIYDEACKQFQRLFEAEQMKFNMGESSLFLLNSRESKLLEALQKLVELKSKFFQSFSKLNWAAGSLQ